MTAQERHWARTPAIAITLAAVCAFLWWAWMGRLNRMTYTEFEVVGCGVCVVVAVVAAMLAVPARRAAIMVPAATAGFSYAWATTAAAEPHNDGLWPVGLLCLVVSMLFGLSVVRLTVLGLHHEGRARSPKRDS